MKPPKMTSAACHCGKVALQIEGRPILRGICYCRSCQQAGRLHQAEANTDSMLAGDGGTDYVLYRKDRVRCVSGGELLEARRLKPDSPTRRMFARCCNSAMFLDFTKGHWLTIYRARLPDELPPATMRVMTADRPQGAALPDDTTNYRGVSGQFMLKLLGAWIAMGFRRPTVEGVPEG